MATLATMIDRGTLAARPATMPEGALYFVTDTSTLYRSDGATWESVEGGAAYTAENARDDIAAALVGGTGISVTPSDGSDTITITATGGVAPAAHTHPASDVTDFAEAVDDRVGALLVEGTGIDLTYDDGAGTLTVAAAAGGLDLDDLGDINAGSPSDGNVLTWDASPGEWIAAAPAAAAAADPLDGFHGTQSYFGCDHYWPLIGSTGNIGLGANVMYAHGFVCPKAGTLDRLQVYQGTAAAGGNTFRLGIFSPSSSTGLAGARLYDSGTIAGDTTGSKEATLSLAVTKHQCLYLVILASAAMSFEGVGSIPFIRPMGWASGFTTGTPAGLFHQKGHTYAAFPDPFGTGPTANSTFYRILARIT